MVKCSDWSFASMRPGASARALSRNFRFTHAYSVRPTFCAKITFAVCWLYLSIFWLIIDRIWYDMNSKAQRINRWLRWIYSPVKISDWFGESPVKVRWIVILDSSSDLTSPKLLVKTLNYVGYFPLDFIVCYGLIQFMIRCDDSWYYCALTATEMAAVEYDLDLSGGLMDVSIQLATIAILKII